jgi:hypothetical protein
MGNPPKPGPRRLDFFPKSAHSGIARKVSFQIGSEGEAVMASLKDSAENNLAGPEAEYFRHIKGLLVRTLRMINDWESRISRLPKGSVERIGLEKKIDLEATFFRNEVASWTVRTSKELEAKGGGALDKFKKLLPDYLRKCIDRGGVVVPGVPGAFEPRTDKGIKGGPTGMDYKFRF